MSSACWTVYTSVTPSDANDTGTEVHVRERWIPTPAIVTAKRDSPKLDGITVPAKLSRLRAKILMQWSLLCRALQIARIPCSPLTSQLTILSTWPATSCGGGPPVRFARVGCDMATLPLGPSGPPARLVHG